MIFGIILLFLSMIAGLISLVEVYRYYDAAKVVTRVCLLKNTFQI